MTENRCSSYRCPLRESWLYTIYYPLMKIIATSMKWHAKCLNNTFFFCIYTVLTISIAELRRPKAVLRSPIPIEPMHSFSHGHLDQRHMARRRVGTHDDNDVAQHGVHNLWMQLTPLQLGIRDPFYGQLTAVKQGIRWPVNMTISQAQVLNSSSLSLFIVDRWQDFGFSFDRRLKYFHKL